MAIVIKTQSVETNKTATFDFGSSTVLNYIVGVSWWDFTFGGDDHHVKTLQLDLTNNQPVKGQVTSKVTAKLQDDSGNTIKNSSSSVVLCCIAVVDAADGNLALGSATGIASGSQSAPLSVPSSSLAIGSSVISGFKMAYDGDHHVEKIETSVGFTPDGSSAVITAQCEMIDDSGHGSSTNTMDGAMIAASPGESALVAKTVADKQTTTAFDVDLGVNLQSAAVLLQSLTATFGSSDHHVKKVGGGTSGFKVAGTKVTLDNAYAFISDDSGHGTNNDSSSVSLLVVGVKQ